jgi:hypothetical protein
VVAYWQGDNIVSQKEKITDTTLLIILALDVYWIRTHKSHKRYSLLTAVTVNSAIIIIHIDVSDSFVWAGITRISKAIFMQILRRNLIINNSTLNPCLIMSSQFIWLCFHLSSNTLCYKQVVKYGGNGKEYVMYGSTITPNNELSVNLNLFSAQYPPATTISSYYVPKPLKSTNFVFPLDSKSEAV